MIRQKPKLIRLFALASSCLVAAFGQTCASRKYTSHNDFGVPQINAFFEAPTRVTIGNESNFSPTLSPNGAYMFYTSDRSGNKDIYVKKTRGGYATPITNHPADDFSPVMSPNGKYIAFVSRRTNAAGAIHVMEVGATISNLGGIVEPTLIDVNLRELENRNPAWFPDSKKIVFSGREMGSREPKLYLATIGSDPVITQLGDIRGDYPTVSSDGTKIAYSRSGIIYVLEIGKNIETQLTDGTLGIDGHPNFLHDNKTIIFIRYADDTNGDGSLTPDDRPTIWSLDINEQMKPDRLGRESFTITPVTSASRSSFYPRHFPPYIYFASEDAESLDVYRLPETGHTKNHSSISETLANFEMLGDDEDKIYVLRRDAAIAASRGDLRTAGEISLKELEWLRELGRTSQAKNLRKKIASELSSNTELQARADIQMISIELAPYRYPDPVERLPGDFRDRTLSWRKQLADIALNIGIGSADIHAYCEYVLAEIDATLGNFDVAKKRLKEIAIKYPSQPAVSAKALAYLARIQSAQSQLDHAIATTLLLAKSFPDELTTINSAAIDLTFSIGEDDSEAVNKLARLIKASDGLGTIRSHARKRLGDILKSNGKYEAAKGEYRTILKESGAPPYIYLQVAKNLIQQEEAEGRYSVVLGIFDDLNTALNSSSDERILASDMESEFHVRRGRLLLNNSESLLAQKEFQRAIEINAMNMSATEGLIDVSEIRNSLKETITHQRKLVSDFPRDAINLYLLAYAIQKQRKLNNSQRSKEISESIELLETARQINGQVPQFHKLLGKLYLEKAHLLKANSIEESVAARLALGWKNTKSFFGFQEPNWIELSIDSSLTALYLTNDDSIEKADLSLQLANTYFENQTFTLSLRHYLRRITALTNQPMQDALDELKLFRHAGRAAFYSDELKLAADLQRKSLQLAGKSNSKIDQAYSLDALALTLREQKKFNEARILYSRLLEIQSKLGNKSNLVTTRINIAYCYMMAGMHDLALEEYRKSENLLTEIRTEEDLKTSDGIMIDIAGENSAARGFTKLDKKIQIAAFRTQISESIGDYRQALQQIQEKIGLLNEKRTQGKKFGFGDGFLAEEMSIAYNNAGYILTNTGKLPEAAKHFTESISFARKLRTKTQEFPARAEWLNLLDLARAQLRRADLQSLPKEEQTSLEAELDNALKELAKGVLAGNREATLAAAALNSVSAQLLSVDSMSTSTRKGMAQARFQDSILLAQKLGMELPFVSSANLNLDREAAADSPNYNELVASHTDFRRSALVRPGLAWKYLATRGLCIQAIEALSSHVNSGGKLLETDAGLMRNCIDAELSKTSVEQSSKSRLLRQYYFIMSNIVIFSRQTPSNSENMTQMLELFRLGKPERIGASLNEGEILITTYRQATGSVTIEISSPRGREGLFEARMQSGETLGSAKPLVEFMEKATQLRNLERLYVVTDDRETFSQIVQWSHANKKTIVSFLPSPDFLPNAIANRQMHFGARQVSSNEANDTFWRGYLERIADGDISPIVLISGTKKIDDTDFRTSLYESTLDEALRDHFNQAVIVGYPGLNKIEAKKNAERFLKRALVDHQNAFRNRDVELAYLRAKESFFYAWLSGDKDKQYQASQTAYQSSLSTIKKLDLVYFLNMERHFSAELNKGYSALREIEAAEAQLKGGKLDDAERLIQKLKTSKTVKGLQPHHVGQLHELAGKTNLQRRNSVVAVENFEVAVTNYKKARDYSAAARCEMQLARLYAYEFFDFTMAKKHIVSADSFSLSDVDSTTRFDIKILTARILIQSHNELEAHSILLKLIKDDSSRLSAAELSEIYLTISESLHRQSKLEESNRYLNEAMKQISRAASVAGLSQSIKMRANNQRAMNLAAAARRDEAISLFNSTLLQAIESKNAVIERDIRHNLAHWHRQWGEYAMAATMFESAIKINGEISSRDPQQLSFNLTESANLALTLALNGNLLDAEKLIKASLSNPDFNHMKYATIFATLVESDILLLQKKVKEAKKSLEKSERDAQKFNIKNLLWRAQYGMGVIASSEERFNEAVKHFTEAYDFISTIPIGVQRAEFSSGSISQASTLSLCESYILALNEAGNAQQALNVALTLEMAAQQDGLGTPATKVSAFVEQLSNLSGNERLFVYYFIGRSKGLIFNLSTRRLETKALDLTTEELASLLGDFNGKNPQKSKAARLTLSKKLLGPIKNDVQSAKFFSPISTLTIADIPFAGLELNGKDLVDNTNISILPIGSNLANGESLEAGGPYLKVLGVLLPQERTSIFAKERVILPRFFPDALILSDENLNSEKVQNALSGKQILHLSAQYREQPGELSRSRVIFARKNQKAGFLDVQMITKSKSTPKLVFVGQPSTNGTLASAFIESGASWVILNSSPNQETDALFFTKNFYSAFKKTRDPCRSVWEAQRKTKKFIPESKSWSHFKIYGHCVSSTQSDSSKSSSSEESADLPN